MRCNSEVIPYKTSLDSLWPNGLLSPLCVPLSHQHKPYSAFGCVILIICFHICPSHLVFPHCIIQRVELRPRCWWSERVHFRSWVAHSSLVLCKSYVNRLNETSLDETIASMNILRVPLSAQQNTPLSSREAGHTEAAATLQRLVFGKPC